MFYLFILVEIKRLFQKKKKEKENDDDDIANRR